MSFWNFWRKNRSPLNPEQLQAALMECPLSISRLTRFAHRHRSELVEHAPVICRIPDGIRSNPELANSYVQKLGFVAEFLAKECDSPALWERLVGNDSSNPILKWTRWYESLPAREQNLKYPALIQEAREYISEAEKLRGTAPTIHLAYLNAHLAGLLFNSGHPEDSIPHYLAALEVCQKSDDLEGVSVYLESLMEVHRYLGDIGKALEYGQQLIDCQRRSNSPADDAIKKVERIRKGEPLLRVVCMIEDRRFELDELTHFSGQHVKFVFERNRRSLAMASTLVEQGNQLASAGKLADAMEKYQQASEIDPFNPDPHYQLGYCLIHMGMFAKAVEEFQEVDRLAPGWFHSRSNLWLTQSQVDALITEEEVRVYTLLEDSPLPKDQTISIARQAIAKFPDFGPLYLLLGDLLRDNSNSLESVDLYRKGLALTEEPDLRTRLLVALAALLPPDSPERLILCEEAIKLNGNLTATATAHLIKLL